MVIYFSSVCRLLSAVAPGAGGGMCGLAKAELCDEVLKIWPYFIWRCALSCNQLLNTLQQSMTWTVCVYWRVHTVQVVYVQKTREKVRFELVSCTVSKYISTLL